MTTSHPLNHVVGMGEANQSPDPGRGVVTPQARTGSPRQPSTGGRTEPAFTLVEMVVVISIIVIILALALPAVSALWNDRKAAEAENRMQGMFMTARAVAMKADGVETGLLFFLDDRNVQHIATIARLNPVGVVDANNRPCIERPFAWGNVFEITDDREVILSPPMRVVPRYVVDDPTKDPDGWRTFDTEELACNDFLNPCGGSAGEPQRHRNYFAMVYSAEGQLLVGRDVLIYDPDANGSVGGWFGDRTGLPVGSGPCPADAATTQYYTRSGAPDNIDSESPASKLPFLITDGSDIAIDFPTVDGLLVYDDSLFVGAGDPDQTRDYLMRSGQPLYISRWTGVVIRGPLGENVVPE